MSIWLIASIGIKVLFLSFYENFPGHSTSSELRLWLRLLALGLYLLLLAWRIVVPDVKRTVIETQKAYSKWGMVRGSGVWRGDDGVAEAIERGGVYLKAADRVMVYSGAGIENIPDWRNLGAMAGWFLPRGATLVSGDDPTRSGANVVLSNESIGRPPLPDDWQCVYDEWAAKVYRYIPGSGVDDGKYARYSQDVPLLISPAWPPFAQVARRLAFIIAACAVWMMRDG